MPSRGHEVLVGIIELVPVRMLALNLDITNTSSTLVTNRNNPMKEGTDHGHLAQATGMNGPASC